MRALVVAVAVVAMSAPAVADVGTAFGRPVPAADLPAGTIAVRAVGSTMSEPLTGYRVTLVVDGISLYATTGQDGGLRFDGIRANASVVASVADPKGARVSSEPFTIPSDSGVRLTLTIHYRDDTARERSARDTSGHPIVNAASARTLVVRLTYDDLFDPKPPTGIAVTLVGYPVTGATTVVTRTSDARGEVKFEQLDDTGATAYYAMTQLVRNGHVDRLVSEPITLARARAARVVLSSERRDSKAAPIDDEPKIDPPSTVPAGKIRIKLAGASEAKAAITLVDAATGGQLATATITSPDDHVDVAIKTRRSQVVYAETVSRGRHYRSHPFQTLASTGTATSLYIMPTIVAAYRFVGEASDPLLRVSAHVELTNYTWTPTPLDSEIPLPHGFTNAQGDDPAFRFTTTGFAIDGPLAPGSHTFELGFDLHATATKIAWSLDLPYGAWNSLVAIVKEPGVSVTPPPGLTVETKTQGSGDYLMIADLKIPPKQSLAMTITVPALPPIDRVCRPLQPDRTPLAGKPMPDFSLPQLDGTKLKLSLLRGKVLVVTFMASWDQLSGEERPTIAKLAAAVPTAVPVLVFSDADPKQVRPIIDLAAKYRVVLDAPVGDTNIGSVTASWGTTLLPESYVIDRKGLVRYYFANKRDWSTTDATACITALARE